MKMRLPDTAELLQELTPVGEVDQAEANPQPFPETEAADFLDPSCPATRRESVVPDEHGVRHELAAITAAKDRVARLIERFVIGPRGSHYSALIKIGLAIVVKPAVDPSEKPIG